MLPIVLPVHALEVQAELRQRAPLPSGAMLRDPILGHSIEIRVRHVERGVSNREVPAERLDDRCVVDAERPEEETAGGECWLRVHARIKRWAQPNESRLSCGALKRDSFLNLRAPSASSAC